MRPEPATRAILPTGEEARSLLAEGLAEPDRWPPAPGVAERDAWLALSSEVRDTIVAAADAALGEPWPHLPATLFLGFVRAGDRARYEAPYMTRRRLTAALVLGECVEDRGRFLDAAADALWSLCEESTWVVPAHLSLQSSGPGLPEVREPVVDLFAGETAALIAWAEHLLGPRLDDVHPQIRERMRHEVDARMLTPCLERDFWWMSATNNWNPWCVSNWLTSILIFETDPGRRVAAVLRATEILQRYLDGHPADGGCDEGPTYWGRAGGCLITCLEILHDATGGRIDVFTDPLIVEIGRYLYRMHIHDRWVVNFADASPKIRVPPGVVRRYGRRSGDRDLAGFGAYLETLLGPTALDEHESLGTRVLDLFFAPHDVPAEAPYLRDVWLPDIEVMVARSAGGRPEGLTVAAKGGHNGEHHNHNDVGNFVVYADGLPVIVDAGVGTYTRQTFGPDRYDLWYMRSDHHNVPLIGGVDQPPGPGYRAGDVTHHADDRHARVRMDIASAYPKEAGVEGWIRTVELDRSADVVTVTDEHVLRAPASEIVLTLLTPCSVHEDAPGRLLLVDRQVGTARAWLEFFPEDLASASEEVPLEDPVLEVVWGPSLFAIRLCAARPCERGRFEVRIGHGPTRRL